MRAIRHAAWLAIAAGLIATGCTRASFRTEVHPDGSWARMERFMACNETALEEAFVLPAGGGWISIRAEETEGASHTSRRTFRAGETLRRDLVVKRDEAGKVTQRLASEITMREDGARRWHYLEVLRWHGPRPTPLLDRERELRRLLEEGLPEGLTSEEDLKDLVAHTVHAAWRVLVGPGEGWQAGLGHAEYGERHARMRLGIAIDRLLVGKLGRRLADDKRRAIVRKLVAALPLRAGEETNARFDENDAGAVPLMFVVKMPGRLVATNGEFDPVAGEVVWGLQAAAPALEAVVLTATSGARMVKEDRAARGGGGESER
jgi:hypothetical protein